jgi:hypothetical protein
LNIQQLRVVQHSGICINYQLVRNNKFIKV